MSARYRLAVGWLTLFVIGTDLFIVSPLLPRVSQEFRASGAAAGLSVTVFAVAYMLGAPVFGIIADRSGRRTTLLASLLVFAAANAATAAAQDFTCLLVSRTVAGAAAAGVTPLIYAGIGDAAPPSRRATWMAVAVSGLLLSLSAGAPSGALLADAFGWRVPFVALAALTLLLAAGTRLGWPADAASGRDCATAAIAPGGTALAVRLAATVFWATALYGTYTYLGVGLADGGFSPSQIARAISLYGIAALAGT